MQSNSVQDTDRLIRTNLKLKSKQMKKIDEQANTFNFVVSVAISIVIVACTYRACIDEMVGGGHSISLFMEWVMMASFFSICTYVSYMGLSALWNAFRKFTK